MAKVYAQVSAVVFLIVGVVGFLTPSLGPLKFSALHNIVHLVIGAWGVHAGFMGGQPKQFAQVIGVVYTLVGLLGLVAPSMLGGIGGVYVLIHLVFGVWGLYAGFFVKEGS
ncbi:MAG: DUF4395 family protein [Armatimonadetes bacterium]|nr:DUF4395 family protein [Armatimonadota bacterium]